MDLTYAVVGNDGELRIETGNYRTAVGPGGPDRVTLHPSMKAAGWVNGDGYADLDRYPINVVGSALLYLLGAAARPYAGPVVITSWEEPPGREVLPLGTSDDLHQGVTGPFLERTVADIRRCLELEDGPFVAFGCNPEKVADVREFTGWLPSAPIPRLSVVPLGDAAPSTP